MCTIIVAIDHFASARVVIAANRDEAYARPTLPGTRLEPGIVGGLEGDASSRHFGVALAWKVWLLYFPAH